MHDYTKNQKCKGYNVPAGLYMYVHVYTVGRLLLTCTMYNLTCISITSSKCDTLHQICSDVVIIIAMFHDS